MKVKVGVVGVGSDWESRRLPALRALPDRFEVRAVCDPVGHRAAQAARTLQADVHDGFRTLIARDDVEAILLFADEWYGALPLYAACEAGKGIYCAAALELRDEEAADLRDQVRESGVAFMAEFPCRLSPATLRLKELIATKLGRPRLLFCNRRQLVGSTPADTEPCEHDLIELIDWCRYMVDDEPSSLLASMHCSAKGPSDYFSLSLDFSPVGDVGTGPLAIIACGEYVAPQFDESLAYRRPADMKVVCERGIAFLDLPSTLIWFNDAGQHFERLEHERPVGEQMLLHFHRAVESLVLKTASLEDAHRAIAIAHKARLSARNGQRALC
ncbi:MAG: Gfo/Idh/MocA family oxidoreductase [Pirellulales bacterium]|nr:Gfo/Idh/MocA family oxidoreductase [Pirellulales bacterium]MBX3434051.1 Gfo/Idh/MocA family oxidoreductase [Pirellulales bacterium]